MFLIFLHCAPHPLQCLPSTLILLRPLHVPKEGMSLSFLSVNTLWHFLKILQISMTHYFVLVDAEGLADSTLSVGMT